MKTLLKIFSVLICFSLIPHPAIVKASVQDELDALRQKFLQNADPQRANDFEQGIADVKNSGILESALNTGEQAPNFKLPDATGTEISLYDLLKDGPVVLVWYRGGWCPYCNIHLNALQRTLPQIKTAEASLVAVSPELPDKTLTTKEKHNLEFYVLSDKGNQVAKSYGIVFTLPDYVLKHYNQFFDIVDYNGDQTHALPLAAAYVINRQGTVTYTFLDADYRKRAEPETLLAEVQKLKVTAI
ncbi:MAG: AhpC/TSA family protein [Candidatus Omnitrophica bacterium]|nr:AhpC/TSA family protein [Candidatus Omnitrophota bacterium]MCB9799850.1 AhpC/TSA family protein [Candidatus Omnitrophota bacterium]